MFSDVCGYTALMGRDEHRAIEVLAEHRELLRGLIPKFNGKMLNEAGDGVLMSFQSAVDAVNCARELQARRVEDPDLRVRIGIHIGDAVFAEGGAFGDGVNVASRIHALAAPGGICISERVYDEIRNQPDIPATLLGEKHLKNVNRPIRFYALDGFGAPLSDTGAESPDLIGAAATGVSRRRRWYALAASGVALALLVGAIARLDIGGWRDRLRGGAITPRIESLAVLPLANLSGDSRQDYFADGMTDELTTNLAQIGALRVTSRTSAMQFKDTRKPLPKIAKELNVDALVEGSVVRLGDRVRITAQLIEARTDRHLWANSYERDSRDVLAMQDELTRDIADEIRVKLTAEKWIHQPAARPVDPEAYDAYLRGRFFWNQRTRGSLAKAQDYFEHAIAKDPGFAPAYSGLADAYLYRGYIWGHLPPREAMPLAKAAALKAIELNDRLAEGHTSLAMVKTFYDWDFSGAEQEYKRAISLNPNYATAHHFYAINLAALGRPDESIAEARKAMEADPLSVPVNNVLGEMLIDAHRYNEAIAQFRKALEMNPNTNYVHENLRRCYLAKGLLNEAFEEQVKALVCSGVMPQQIDGLRAIYLASGWPGILKTSLPVLLASWNKDHWHMDAYIIGAVYAGLGEKDQAFAWFDKLIELRSGMVIWPIYIEHDRWEEDLRSDPRFAQLKRKTETPP